MKAGIFEQMTPKKKVELIENVANSMLGLEGMKIVVACDKSRQENIYDKITFDTIGRMFKQNKWRVYKPKIS